MRKPDENDRISCPNKPGEELIPERVWDTNGPQGPQRMGIRKKHFHGATYNWGTGKVNQDGQECEYGGLPGEVWPKNKKD